MDRARFGGNSALLESSFGLSVKQKITTQYILALGLIGVLVTISYLALLELMTIHASWASMINLSGKQRMLSQRIARLAHDLVAGNHEDSVELRQSMLNALEAMESAQGRISRGRPSEGLFVDLSNEAREILDHPPYELNKQVNRFSMAVREFAAIPYNELSVTEKSFLIIEEYTQGPLLDAMDALVFRFQMEAEKNNAIIKQRMTRISILLLLSLVAAGVFIFRPLARRIQVSTNELAENQRTLSGITGSLAEGVITTDKEGVIRFVNPMALSITGYKEKELLGKRVKDLPFYSLEGEALGENCPISRALKNSAVEGAGAMGRGHIKELFVEKKSGKRAIVEMNAAPIMDRGYIAGAVAAVRDITMRKTMEEIVAAKTERVNLLQEIAFAVNDAKTVDEAISVCLELVCQRTYWQIGHVYKPDNEDILYPSDLWYSKDKEKFEIFTKVTRNTSFRSGIGLPGRVYQNKKPAWIRDVQNDVNFPRASVVTDIGVRAGFAFPVLEGEKVVAVLEFFSSQAMEEDESLLSMGNYLSAQLGRVTERKRDLELILAEKEKAEEATKLKDKFISLVAHDLRTPLTTMMGLYRSIKNDKTSPLSSTQESIVDKTIISGENMLEMIDNLLDLERLQTGQMKISKLLLDVNALAEEIIESLEYEARAKEISLVNDVEKGVKTFADYELIVETIKNLVHNSIKFCQPGDKVYISTGKGEEEHAIIIRDTGPGIRKDVRDDIFKHDVKTSTPGSAGERGTGLGLPLCHDIIAAHGGQLALTRSNENGVTFQITLPKMENAEPKPA